MTDFIDETDDVRGHPGVQRLIRHDLALREENARLRGALKPARLMLYAWHGARLNMGLADDHKELNEVIRQTEDALKVPS